MAGGVGVKVSIIVVALAAAGTIFFVSRREPQATVASDAKPVDVLCTSCGHQYQLAFPEFSRQSSVSEPVDESRAPRAGVGRRRVTRSQEAALTCPSCGAKAARLALHCEKHDKYYAKFNADGTTGKCPDCPK